MFTLLGALAGLAPLLGSLVSIIPMIMKYLEKRTDNAHEIQLAELRMKANAQNFDFEKAMEEVKALAEQQKAVLHHDETLDGGPTINKLRASVRPVVTYAFFGMFMLIKLAMAFTMVYQGYTIPDISDVIFDLYTLTIFGSIMGFWFGSRLIEKMDK